MVAFIGGLVAFVVGLMFLIGWWSDFLAVIKGTLPLLFLLGGLIALYGGYTSQQDKKEAEKEEEKAKKGKKQ